MSKTRNVKKTVKNIMSVFLAVLLCFCAIFGLTKIFGDNTQSMKKISSTIFHVGGLNVKGEYVDTDDTIYSDLFECRGLTIEQDFESLSKYQVFFYNEDKVFIGRTDEFRQESYSIDDEFDIAKFCRVVINPMQSGDDSETFKIRFYEVLGYANDLTIKVYSKQNFVSKNYVVNAVLSNVAFSYSSGDLTRVLTSVDELNTAIFTDVNASVSGSLVSFSKNENVNVLGINVNAIGSLKIDNTTSSVQSVMFFKSDKTYLSTGTVDTAASIILKVPDSASYCLIAYNSNANLSVKKYSVK